MSFLHKFLHRGEEASSGEKAILHHINLPPGSGFTYLEELSGFFDDIRGLKSFREQLAYEKEFINEWGGES